MFREDTVKTTYCLFCRPGELSEWLKEHAWKACIRETVSRVRIPHSPPLKNQPPVRLLFYYFSGGLQCSVLRNESLWTLSDPEGSSNKQFLSCAAGAPVSAARRENKIGVPIVRGVFFAYYKESVFIIKKILEMPLETFPGLFHSYLALWVYWIKILYRLLKRVYITMAILENRNSAI